MRYLALVVAVLAVGCGSSSTAPTPDPPKLPTVAVPCDLPGTLPCQTPPKTTPAPAQPTSFTLTGNVLDARTHDSVFNATVALSTGAGTRTDGTGHYTISNVAVGDVVVTASASGFVTQTRRFTVTSDGAVDFALLRTPGGGGDGAPADPLPPTPAHGGLRSDTMTIPYDLIVGSPVPTASQSATYCCWPFPVLNQGAYDFTLDRFPLDVLPSGGASNTISASEMILAGVKFSAVTTQPSTMTWHRVIGTDQSMFIATIPAGVGAEYSYVGHFSWEITLPGWYYVVLDSEFGRLALDFVVSGTTSTLTARHALTRPATVPTWKGGYILGR
jgi:hypothetical protein